MNGEKSTISCNHWEIENLLEAVGPHPDTQTAKFFWQIKVGRYFRYPLCCSIRFAYDYAFSKRYSGQERGGIHRRWECCGAPHVWVPCGLFHHPDPGWEPNRV